MPKTQPGPDAAGTLFAVPRLGVRLTANRMNALNWFTCIRRPVHTPPGRPRQTCRIIALPRSQLPAKV
jgi:hypothetical protein